MTINFDRLYTACNRNGWFTCGTNAQYKKLFYANDMKAPVEELATIIWLCSDDEIHCRRDILAKLKELEEEYLMDIADKQQADGERATDEVYCGYYD